MNAWTLPPSMASICFSLAPRTLVKVWVCPVSFFIPNAECHRLEWLEASRAAGKPWGTVCIDPEYAEMVVNKGLQAHHYHERHQYNHGRRPNRQAADTLDFTTRKQTEIFRRQTLRVSI